MPLIGFASLSLPNTEAAISLLLCRKAVEDGRDVVIATNDKDLLQLTGERVSIYSTAKADTGSNGFALLGRKN